MPKEDRFGPLIAAALERAAQTAPKKGRRERGLTLDELARAAGCSVNRASRWTLDNPDRWERVGTTGTGARLLAPRTTPLPEDAPRGKADRPATTTGRRASSVTLDRDVVKGEVVGPTFRPGTRWKVARVIATEEGETVEMVDDDGYVTELKIVRG